LFLCVIYDTFDRNDDRCQLERFLTELAVVLQYKQNPHQWRK